jgi:membrane fusion protein (multidrug efflux system)
MSKHLPLHLSPSASSIAVRVICLLALGLAAGTACTRTPAAGAEEENAKGIAVRVYPVEEKVVQRNVEAVGSLYALEESVVSAEVEGRVEKVLVDIGDLVQEGQPLVTLSPVELEYELQRQRAAVRQVRARLGLQAGQATVEDPEGVAFVQRAEADRLEAEQNYMRARQLFGDQLISQQQLDQAAARFKGARAGYEEAVQEVEQLKAQLQSSEAARLLAEKKLADAVIRSPFPGAVKERRVSPGEYLSVQSPVAVVVRTDRLRARLAVPEKWAGALRVGTPVEVHVEAYPGEVFRGELVRINPAVSQETRTFEVEALLANPEGKLKPGFFVQATLATKREEKVLSIPAQAVSYRHGVYKVFVVEGEKAQEREIQTGTQQGSEVEVVDGLTAADRVAVAVEGELRDGVNVRAEPAAPSSP